MKLSLVSIEREGYIRLASEGPATAADFAVDQKNPLEQILGVSWATNRVVLNMDRCTYIDSSAIGWLIGTQKAFKNAGGSFVVHSLQPSVRNVLDMLKVGKVVPIAETESQAKELALKGQGDSK
jgi:anti-anti-sigma factor